MAASNPVTFRTRRRVFADRFQMKNLVMRARMSHGTVQVWDEVDARWSEDHRLTTAQQVALAALIRDGAADLIYRV